MLTFPRPGDGNTEAGEGGIVHQRTLASRRGSAALVALAGIIAVALLSSPAGFGPGEPGAEAALLNELKKLTASDAQDSDNFGWSIAVSGDTAVVGAYLEDAGGGSAGAAYLFQRDQGGLDNWGEAKKLTASDAQDDDWFGYSVAVSGNTAIVGAASEDGGGNNVGATRAA